MVSINTNIFSLLVQKNLTQSSRDLQQSYQRLSSGEKINTSADDPAGMASSERLRYEIAGLRQNQQNVSGAVSLIGTTESYFDSMTNLLQRARELAVQAGNETLQPSDRGAIQSELTQINSEIDRISSTAKFNDQYLLNGQLQNAKIQVGTTANDTVSLSLGDYRVSSLGARAFKQSATPVAAGALLAGALTVNGQPVPASVNDGVSSTGGFGSALAKANAINQIESQTGVHATAMPTTLTGTSAVGAGSINSTTQTLQINGITITGVTVSANDDNRALVSAINDQTTKTGVTASVDAAGKLTLSAADGRNIQISTTGGVGGIIGLAAPGADINSTQTGTVQLNSTHAFTLGDASGQLGMGSGTITVTLDPTTALQNSIVRDGAAAGNTLQTIDAALSQISDARANIGSVSNRLSALSDTLSSRVNDLTSADSSIRNTDFAFESARLAQGQILQNAAIAMLTQANVIPKQALDLLNS